MPNHRRDEFDVDAAPFPAAFSSAGAYLRPLPFSATALRSWKSGVQVRLGLAESRLRMHHSTALGDCKLLLQQRYRSDVGVHLCQFSLPVVPGSFFLQLVQISSSFVT